VGTLADGQVVGQSVLFGIAVFWGQQELIGGSVYLFRWAEFGGVGSVERINLGLWVRRVVFVEHVTKAKVFAK
jgi:hypothetical protein